MSEKLAAKVWDFDEMQKNKEKKSVYDVWQAMKKGYEQGREKWKFEKWDAHNVKCIEIIGSDVKWAEMKPIEILEKIRICHTFAKQKG